MGLPPTLPDIVLSDENRLPIGTLLFNDISKELAIVAGYWPHGQYRNPGDNWTDWGYKEIHSLYLIDKQRYINVDIQKHPETGYCEWEIKYQPERDK